MADGTNKPIKNIELAISFRPRIPNTGASSDQPVVATHNNLDTHLADMEVVRDEGDNEVIHTTQTHPFWAVNLAVDGDHQPPPAISDPREA